VRLRLARRLDVTLVPAPSAPPVDTGDPRSDYQAAEKVGTLEAWDLFLARHSTGFFADLAREQRAKMLQGEDKPAVKAARKRQEEERKIAARKAEAEVQKKRAEEERQRAERERVQREQAQREQAQREQAQREQAQREQAQREQAQREQAARNE